ncbi:Uncharacterized membrane protein YkoI [Modicisalibacter muralis]|uniref:Uncharacterized membrane protein YkoI n=1 Tax=Modicisalibacter muralis TaxID=119000 RepID=A0A1G9JID5_9GAMM|nr:PepSY domain-containing protein [Halomonas muralis]SDL37151.1 Uncharacterized membrane protein YkoI [Halomonas muralis]
MKTFKYIMLIVWLALTSVVAIPATLAYSDDDDWRDLHEEVRAGRFVSLPSVLDWLEARYRGQVLGVELERNDGLALYEVEMIGPQGQLVEFVFDAASGELVGIDGVNIEGMKRQ